MALDSIAIGKRIKQYRTQKQLSQEDLGNVIGVTRKHLSKIEIGERAPTLDLLILIANALDVSADDLLVGNLTRREGAARHLTGLQPLPEGDAHPHHEVSKGAIPGV